MMMSGWMKWPQIIFIVIGSAIYAFGLYAFIIPNELMEGGITGIALLLNYIFGISPSLTTLLLNIPLFYIGWKMFGTKSIALTMLGTISLSIFLSLFAYLDEMDWFSTFATLKDPFLIVLYAGLTLGSGLGIVFRNGGTTGGADIIARIGNKRLGVSMGRMILIFDSFVIGASLIHISVDKILYTLVVVFIASRTIDLIQEGAHASRAFMIVSERPREIADSIIEQLDHSATLFKATGGYTKQEKEVVYCVVFRHEASKLKALVRQYDPNAFIIIQDIQDVLGEGFERS